MSQRQVPASHMYGFRASIGQMNWKVEVCFLELDVDKTIGIDGHIGICVPFDGAVDVVLERSLVEVVEEDPHAPRHEVELDPLEIVFKFCRVRIAQINLVDSA